MLKKALVEESGVTSGRHCSHLSGCDPARPNYTFGLLARSRMYQHFRPPEHMSLIEEENKKMKQL